MFTKFIVMLQELKEAFKKQTVEQQREQFMAECRERDTTLGNNMKGLAETISRQLSPGALDPRKTYEEEELAKKHMKERDDNEWEEMYNEAMAFEERDMDYELTDEQLDSLDWEYNGKARIEAQQAFRRLIMNNYALITISICWMRAVMHSTRPMAYWPVFERALRRIDA